MTCATPRAALLPATSPRLQMAASSAFDEINDLIDQLVMEAAAEGRHIALRTGHPERDESFDVDLFKSQLRAACVKVMEDELTYTEEALLADHARLRTLLNRRPSKAGSALAWTSWSESVYTSDAEHGLCFPLPSVATELPAAALAEAKAFGAGLDDQSLEQGEPA